MQHDKSNGNRTQAVQVPADQQLRGADERRLKGRAARRIAKFALSALASLALATPERADFTATGQFRYRDRVFSYSGFTGSEPSLPIRKTFVQVLDSDTNTVLASGNTDNDGNFSIFVPASGNLNIVFRAVAKSQKFGNSRLFVTTADGINYSVSSSVFSSWDTSQDLDMGTVISEKVFSGSYQFNPFNALDQSIAAVEYIGSIGGGHPPQNFTVRWPVTGGSSASGTTVNLDQDDGYDDVVILHEVGHVVHNIFSESDNPGGFHSFGQSDQDPRLSFGEGWASFFAGAVRNYKGEFDPGIYIDAWGNGPLFSVGLRKRMENGSPNPTGTDGEADEAAVFCALWDLIDDEATNDGGTTDDDEIDGSFDFDGLSADELQWAAFVSNTVADAPNCTIRDLWDGLFAGQNHGRYDELEGIFREWKINFYLDANEPNNGSANGTAVSPTSSWSSTQTLYYSGATPPVPGINDRDYYLMLVNEGEELRAETRYPGGISDAETYADPHLRIRRPDTTIFAEDDDSGTGRNALLSGLIADTSGEWRFVVRTVHSYRKTGSYQYRFYKIGSAVNSIAPAQVSAVNVGGQTVTLTGQDLDQVTGIQVDGIALTPGSDYQIVNPSTITFEMPLVSQLGLVDIEITTPSKTIIPRIEVLENIPPTLNIEPLSITQATGFDIQLGAGVADFAYVNVSPDLIPTVIPGLFSLDIGNNLTTLFTPWKTLVGGGGSKARHFGPFSGLIGVTVHWQAFVADFDTVYAAPFASSNVLTTTIVN